MTKPDIKLLKQVADGNVFWSKREGGSEIYQTNNKRIHELVSLGFIWEFSPNSCCMREYGITDKGLEVLRNER